MKQDWAAVRQLSSGITDFTDFLRGFRNKILPDGTLDDRHRRHSLASGGRLRNRSAPIPESLRGQLRRLAEVMHCNKK